MESSNSADVLNARAALARITRSDVLSAIKDFESGDIPHSFGPSRDYDLVFDGRLYPPKAIAGLAARRLLGRVPSPDEFSSGVGNSAFRALGRTGFMIVSKGEAPLIEPVEAPSRAAREAAELEMDRLGGGQGFGHSAATRREVELHAMRAATDHFVSAGFEVEDVSGTHPYDLRCRREEEVLLVEVKGTVTGGEQVILTLNEVTIAQSGDHQMALFVLSRIFLRDRDGDVEVTGGEAHVLSPWRAPKDLLTPISFRCQVPRE